MLTSCLPTIDLPPQAEAPAFDPVAFFAGTSEGRGSLTTITGKRQQFHVTSVGTPVPDGSLSLTQQISLEGEPTRERTWIIRPLGRGIYTGTLTEAVGTVQAYAYGNTLLIRYSTKDYMVDQRLVLGSDGAVHNRLDIYKWGLNVARLHETIEKK